jgi:16S rRNA (cytosine1402-N4)-methyltransferase
MMEEVIAFLQLRGDGIYVDMTAGAGGHSERIAASLTKGRLIAIDRDKEAVALTCRRLSPYPAATVVRANYSELKQILERLSIPAADGILLDAGVSSMQIDTAERGFSYLKEGPLDMRMDSDEALDAATWLQGTTSRELEQVLREFGDVGPVRRIARSISLRRDQGKLQTTTDLAEAIREALNHVVPNPTELRQVFQAVRMAVNNELNHLKTGLEQASTLLAPGGRLVVISFHSGEDGVVKTLFRKLTRPQVELRPDGRILKRTAPAFKAVTGRPVQPGPDEIERNSRAKSARVRVIERLATETSGEKEKTNG